VYPSIWSARVNNNFSVPLLGGGGWLSGGGGVLGGRFFLGFGVIWFLVFGRGGVFCLVGFWVCFVGEF